MQTAFELMVAPNGARLTKADHAAVPISAADVAQTAKTCADAGATAIHVHVRDENGGHSLDPQRYANTIGEIAKFTSLPVQFSTESAGQFDVATQRNCLENPASYDASVALREIARAPDTLAQTYRDAAAKNIDIQHILYDASDVTHLLNLYDSGDIPLQSQRTIFVLGRYTKDQVSTPADLKPFLAAMGTTPLTWSVCAFGQNEQACLLAALNAGGHARIGFENNLWAPNGTVFPDNAASVASFVEIADKAGFHPRSLKS
ncbi:MAG: 3-keto-5-aminohexanoate cleavage protein [Planktomarina sp.]